ncbi:MAG: hypothetical protein OHK0048_10500 [Rhodoferax sp.]
MNMAAIFVTAALGQQSLGQQPPHQIAGGGLVNVHALRQLTDPQTRPVAHHTQGPNLRAAKANQPLDLSEMALHRVEYNPESP